MNRFWYSIRESLRSVGPMRFLAMVGVVVSVVGFAVYTTGRLSTGKSFDEGRFVSGSPSFMNCYNAEGKIVYTEDFPRGMWNESSQKYHTLTSDGRRVWVFGIGPFMCREEERK